MSSILISGATGFLGSALVPALLADGHHLTLMTHNPADAIAQFDGKVHVLSRVDDLPGMTKFDIIINLAGASINDGRWNDKQKKELLESRLQVTNHLVAFAKERPPQQFIQASAVGYYGKQTSAPWPLCPEDAPKGEGFLADLSAEWEAAAAPVAEVTNLTVLRFAPIFDRDGGAFPMIAMPYRFYGGARIGRGLQPFPWVHREDVVGIIQHVINRGKDAAPLYNVAAPELIRQCDSVRIIHRYLGGFRPTFRMPRFFFKILFGEKSELVLGGQFAMPNALVGENYRFRFPTLASALPRLFGK